MGQSKATLHQHHAIARLSLSWELPCNKTRPVLFDVAVPDHLELRLVISDVGLPVAKGGFGEHFGQSAVSPVVLVVVLEGIQ